MCKQALKHPVRVNPIPRQIPPAPWYLRPWVRDLHPVIITLITHLLLIGLSSFCRDSTVWYVQKHVVSCDESEADSIILGAAFVELYFVMSSLFASRAYYAFGFLALTAGVVGLTTATVSILFTYFLLCAEEYR